jgi:hypothetical protein
MNIHLGICAKKEGVRMSFVTTPVDAHIVRCKHTGPFECEDTRKLVKFLNGLGRKKLLIDLTEATATITDCVRELQQLRPLMPKAAVFGAEIPADAFKLPKGATYYANEVRWFPTEREALAWLREEVPEPA